MCIFRFGLLAVALASLATPVQSYRQNTPAPSPIVGTWLPESIVDTLADDSHAYWSCQLASA
jgi:hypothetical protein